MADPIDALILDLLEWIGSQPRPYSEVIDAWRTSCPRLPVWEDANDRGFVERGAFVSVTALGREFLERHRPHRAARAIASERDAASEEHIQVEPDPERPATPCAS